MLVCEVDNVGLLMLLGSWSDRIEKIRTQSRLSASYWRVRTIEGETKYVHLNPPGDLARLRQHYPGANGEMMEWEAWLEQIEIAYPDP